MWNRFKTFDAWLYLIPLILISISVLVIYAISIDTASSGLYLRQAIYGLICIPLVLFFTFIDYRALRAWSVWIYLFGIVGLILVMFLGKVEFGAKSWIDFGFFRFQPGEFAKFTVVVALASLLGKPRKASFSTFLFSLVLIFIPTLIIAKQPDFGTAMVVFVMSISLLMSANLQKYQKILVVSGLLALVLTISLSFKGVEPFNHLLKSYQKDRLASFVDPQRDIAGSGYNVLQSVIAVGSGGLMGKGLGFGSQSQLNFLPVPHSDFIFAVISEAWGLVGSTAIILLQAFLIWRILAAASLAKDEFGTLFCLGIAAKIMIELLVNVGMNIRVMPVTGIPLPFLSYGGTTMLTNAIAIGVVQSIVIRYKRLTF